MGHQHAKSELIRRLAEYDENKGLFRRIAKTLLNSERVQIRLLRNFLRSAEVSRLDHEEEISFDAFKRFIGPVCRERYFNPIYMVQPVLSARKIFWPWSNYLILQSNTTDDRDINALYFSAPANFESGGATAMADAFQVTSTIVHPGSQPSSTGHTPSPSWMLRNYYGSEIKEDDTMTLLLPDPERPSGPR